MPIHHSDQPELRYGLPPGIDAAAAERLDRVLSATLYALLADISTVPPHKAPATPGDLQNCWFETVRQLGRSKGVKYNLGALLRSCRPNAVHVAPDGDTLVAPVREPVNLERITEELKDPRVCDTIEQAIAQCFGRPYSFRFILDNDSN